MSLNSFHKFLNFCIFFVLTHPFAFISSARNFSDHSIQILTLISNYLIFNDDFEEWSSLGALPFCILVAPISWIGCSNNIFLPLRALELYHYPQKLKKCFGFSPPPPRSAMNSSYWIFCPHSEDSDLIIIFSPCSYLLLRLDDKACIAST